MKKIVAVVTIMPAIVAVPGLTTAAHGHEYLSCRQELLALTQIQSRVLKFHETRPFRDVKNRKELRDWIKSLARLAGNTARLSSDYARCAENIPIPSGRKQGK